MLGIWQEREMPFQVSKPLFREILLIDKKESVINLTAEQIVVRSEKSLMKRNSLNLEFFLIHFFLNPHISL